jgi:hypothetical protein
VTERERERDRERKRKTDETVHSRGYARYVTEIAKHNDSQ